MGLFSKTEFHSLQDLLISQLEDIYDAEHRLLDSLPKAFAILGKEARRETCPAMKGLVTEGEQVIRSKGDTAVKDAALIAAAQRLEHYEMAAYGSARTFAQRLGYTDLAELLQTTLDEEGAADKLLTQIAEEQVNVRAAV